MFSDKKLKAFIPTVQPEKAKEFYKNTLGLTLISEDAYALEFDACGTALRVTTVQEFKPQLFTVLGWNVDDLLSSILFLNKKGVLFERYGSLKQDENGIWTSPSGASVAWFKDQDGNLLSLTAH